MDTGPVLVIHLVELVDEADTLVGKHKCTTFQSPLACDRVFMNTSRQSDRACTFACSIHYSVINFLNILEELRFGSSWVTKQKHVDISSDSVLPVHIFRLSTKHS